ncbi:MAG: hypothetical protein ACAI35_12950 [Candidatus Methylacidiphilales bacterium]|nr:hypothetical protein [Candidatus Methylacidiphilales bacterium]
MITKFLFPSATDEARFPSSGDACTDTSISGCASRAPNHTGASRIFTSRLLEKWTDPVSGVESYLLSSQRVAPLQQSFYFVNPSLTHDGRYYWFYCGFPPAGNANQGRSLAVVDFHQGEIHHFPETGFSDASPLVDPDTGECYWCTGVEIYKRRPEPDAAPVLVNRLPDEIVRNRRPWRLATHLTFSADRKAVNLDVEIGSEWYIGHAPLNGSRFQLWQRMERCYNHAQYSPADPDLQLIAQDSSVHPITGESENYPNRMWLIRRGTEAKPLYPEPIGNGLDARAMHGHEWWGRDGRHVWYIHYGQGVERYSLEKKTLELVWPYDTLSHAHSNAEENCLVADSVPSDPSKHKVLFRNLQTGCEVAIVSLLPPVDPALRRYHVHPHPQFCMNDELIAYTTTVRGVVDVAFVSVAHLLAHTS